MLNALPGDAPELAPRSAQVDGVRKRRTDVKPGGQQIRDGKGRAVQEAKQKGSDAILAKLVALVDLGRNGWA